MQRISLLQKRSKLSNQTVKISSLDPALNVHEPTPTDNAVRTYYRGYPISKLTLKIFYSTCVYVVYIIRKCTTIIYINVTLV